MWELVQGGAVEAMRALAEESVAAVLTDPPYSSGTRREAAKGIRKSMTPGRADADWFGSDSLTTQGFAFLLRACALEWERVLIPGGSVLCFIDWRMMPTLAAAIESADLRSAGLVVWDKTRVGMGRHFRNRHELVLHFTKGVAREPFRRDVGNVIPCPIVRAGEHPTEKPLPLLRLLLSVVAAPGDLVLDPFAGSGASGVAALLQECRFVGIERQREYCEVARRRLAETTAAGRLPV